MKNYILLLFIGICSVLALSLLYSLPVMWLWNWCFVPAVSGVHEIGWLQAWGIMFLCGLLFKPISLFQEQKPKT